MNNIKMILGGYRPPFIYANFKEYINKLGFSAGDTCQLTSRSPRTIRGWIQNDNAPRWIYYYLYCCAGYILHEDFHGFRVKHGELYTGTRITRNRGFTPGELTEYTFFHDYMYTLKTENARLELLLSNQDQHLLKRSINHVKN